MGFRRATQPIAKSLLTLIRRGDDHTIVLWQNFLWNQSLVDNYIMFSLARLRVKAQVALAFRAETTSIIVTPSPLVVTEDIASFVDDPSD